MAIITEFNVFKESCIVCNKKLPKRRKWTLWHGKCKKKGFIKYNKLLDEALKEKK